MNTNIIFETERLIVRPFYSKKDSENFFSVYGDKEVMEYIRAPKSKEDCDLFLQEVMNDYERDKIHGRWAVEEKSSGDFVGSFVFMPVTNTQDFQLGYALIKRYWGFGFATELMKEGVKYVIEKTDLDKVYGITEAANIASQKVLQKTGFVLFQVYEENGKKVTKFILRRAK